MMISYLTSLGGLIIMETPGYAITGGHYAVPDVPLQLHPADSPLMLKPANSIPLAGTDGEDNTDWGEMEWLKLVGQGLVEPFVNGLIKGAFHSGDDDNYGWDMGSNSDDDDFGFGDLLLQGLEALMDPVMEIISDLDELFS
ncbi:hypothetical protein B0H63DRAFT_151301 [Podospora didyma]|uniref:Uncharacterized protein n=1 Tax=Podospora didyma TaxID=330526 RepID=A0AAE0U184_9PEZI|nr:hypothetical protein B0H63DRAFT_151301 [Podospora didyma]